MHFQVVKKRLFPRLLAFLFAISIALTFAGYFVFFHPNILVKQPNKQIYVPNGVGFKELKHTLIEKKCIENAFCFDLAARIISYDKKVLKGSYLLKSNMSNWEAIMLLKNGQQHPVKVTINSVRDKKTLAKKIASYVEMSSGAIEELLCDSSFVSKYGFNVENVMTMFIPNTYEVYWTISAKELFEKMHAEYKKFWNQTRLVRSTELKLTPQEVYTLASIVQSETNKVDEARVIAGVYMNRLRKKMALEACPTLVYIINDPTIRRVLKKHKNIDSPYNTYKNNGLPPGPICMPSIAMIDAVLNYEFHDYMFFSAKEDFSGYHYFSTSWKEHISNSKKYKQALNRAKIYR